MVLALGAGTIVLYGIVFCLLFAILLLSFKVLSAAFKLRGQRLFVWNNVNGLLFLVFGVIFFAFVFWQFNEWGAMIMTESGSAHGPNIDRLFLVTTAIIMFVFVGTHILLFYFSWKYRGKKDGQALYYPDNDKLEVIWTLVPAVVLTCLITYGFITWTDLTQNPPSEEESNVVELYAYQFGWKARYPGADEKLGSFNFTLIGGRNDMGINPDDPASLDDLRVSEIWLPVDEPVLFKFRAQDVIHSAFMPHFRAQMNVVPGLPTQYYFVPTKTTLEMQQIRNDYDFDYLVFCNKICGAAHYNMKMKIKVVERDEYDAWLANQKLYFTPEKEEVSETESPDLALLN